MPRTPSSSRNNASTANIGFEAKLWRGADDPLRNPHSEVREYADVPGFSKSATTDEIAQHGCVLTSGRYVGAEEIEDDGDPFRGKDAAPRRRIARPIR